MNKTHSTPVLDWQNEHTLTTLSAALCAGQVIISETDTVLGLLSTVTESGYIALNRIKNRSEKPYLILISGKSQLGRYIQLPLPPKVQKIIDTYWPGPLTIIFNANPDIPEFVTGSAKTIALRVPNDPRMLDLIKNTGPLFSTSANLSGQPIPESIELIDKALIEKVAYAAGDETKTNTNIQSVHSELVEESTNKTKALPSTIIDCTQDDIVKIIRQGALKIDA